MSDKIIVHLEALKSCFFNCYCCCKRIIKYCSEAAKINRNFGTNFQNLTQHVPLKTCQNEAELQEVELHMQKENNILKIIHFSSQGTYEPSESEQKAYVIDI